MEKELLDYLPLISRRDSLDQDEEVTIVREHPPASQRRGNISLLLSSSAVLLSSVAIVLAVMSSPAPSTLAFPPSHFTYTTPPTSNPSSKGRTVVGKRALGPMYQGCSSTQFLAALSAIRVDPTGLSALAPVNHSYALDEFDYSFHWPETTCQRPHVFTSAEACDVVGAFGGLTAIGDSLTRHMMNAMFILLRNRPDGGVFQNGDRCRDDTVFDDRDNCRDSIVADAIGQAAALAEPICGGKVAVKYTLSYCPSDPSGYIPSYLQMAPTLLPSLSPLIINAYGLHCGLENFYRPIIGALKPLHVYSQSVFPRPLSLWMGVHAPGSNKPAQYLPQQGVEAVKNYNAEMAARVEAMQPGRIVDGAMGVVDVYGMTDGARSFDGTHFMYQVNMEKAMLLLNLMELLWAEAAEDGGLWAA